jgi:hypothetical protein
MHILTKHDTEVEYKPGDYYFAKFQKGKDLFQRGVKQLHVDGRWLTNIELTDLGVYLRRVNRFKNTTENWIQEFEYFLTTLEGANERRQNARV